MNYYGQNPGIFPKLDTAGAVMIQPKEDEKLGQVKFLGIIPAEDTEIYNEIGAALVKTKSASQTRRIIHQLFYDLALNNARAHRIPEDKIQESLAEALIAGQRAVLESGANNIMGFLAFAAGVIAEVVVENQEPENRKHIVLEQSESAGE